MSSGVTRSTSGLGVKNVGNTTATNPKNTMVVKNSVKTYDNDEGNKSSPNTHRSSLNGGSGFTS